MSLPENPGNEDAPRAENTPGEVIRPAGQHLDPSFVLAQLVRRQGMLPDSGRADPADESFRSFLEANREQGVALAEASDLLDLEPEPHDPPQKYIATYHCRGLVQGAGGDIDEADFFQVGIWFPPNYLDEVNAYHVLTMLGPPNVFQSNIRGPFICLKNLGPGTDLVSILYQLFELLTFQSYALHDPLNQAAAQWARNNKHRLPVDPRPLKRKADAASRDEVVRS